MLLPPFFPVLQLQGCRKKRREKRPLTTQLNWFWNSLLDRPCVVFPVGFVDPAKDPKVPLEKAYTGLPGNLDQQFWDRCKCHLHSAPRPTSDARANQRQMQIHSFLLCLTD